MIAANDNLCRLVGPWLPTAAAARAVGAKHYCTAKPCARGHIAPRYTVSNNCAECNLYKVKTRLESDPEFVLSRRQYAREYMQIKRANDNDYMESARARYREKWHSDPEFRAKKAAWKKEKMATDTEYRERQNELGRPQKRAWKKANPDAVVAAGNRRRARDRSAEGTYAPSDIAAILKRQKYKCVECGISVRARANRNIDHIFPLSLGGSNWPSNLQVLCHTCNSSKGGKHPIDYARFKGRLL